MALLLLLLIGAYYGVRHISHAPAQDSRSGSAAGKVTRAVSAASEVRPEKLQDDVNSKSEKVRDVAVVYSSADSEAGLEAFQPAELYDEYLGAANAGDIDARYVLVTALQECRNGPKSADELAKLERSGLSREVFQAVKNRFLRCKPLFDLVPNVEKEYQERYAALRAAQYPLILVKQRGIPFDRKRQLVTEAISQEYPESYLYASAYLEAAILYREYPARLDLFREEAWILLYCEVSFHCDSKKELDYFRTEKYHAHELDRILAIYSSITTSIEQKDWEALGI